MAAILVWQTPHERSYFSASTAALRAVARHAPRPAGPGGVCNMWPERRPLPLACSTPICARPR